MRCIITNPGIFTRENIQELLEQFRPVCRKHPRGLVFPASPILSVIYIYILLFNVYRRYINYKYILICKCLPYPKENDLLFLWTEMCLSF